MIKRTAQLVSKDITPSGDYQVTLNLGSNVLVLRCTPAEAKEFCDTVVTEPPVGDDGSALGPDGKPVAGQWVTTYLDKLPSYALNIGPMPGYVYPPAKLTAPRKTPIAPESRPISGPVGGVRPIGAGTGLGPRPIGAPVASPFAAPGAKPVGTPKVI